MEKGSSSIAHGYIYMEGYAGNRVLSLCGSYARGIQRQANLRILHDRARQFQNTSFKGLFQFLRFLDQIRASSGDMDMAKTLGENDNVVRLMSIHKSKGLEFPIVIVAGLGRQFNLRDLTQPLLLHKELGLGPRFVDLELRATMDTLPRNIIKQKYAGKTCQRKCASCMWPAPVPRTS